MSEALERGIAAAQAGRKQEAIAALRDAIVQDPRNVDAWLWIARLLDQPQRRRECLERVLQLQPGHAEAQAMLTALDRPASAAPQPPTSERPRTGPLTWKTGQLPPLPQQPSSEDQAWMERLGLVPPSAPPPPIVQPQPKPSPLVEPSPKPQPDLRAELLPKPAPQPDPEPAPQQEEEQTPPVEQEEGWRRLMRRRAGRLPSTLDAEERKQRFRVFLVIANALLVLVVIYFTFIRPPAGSQFESLVFRPTPLPSPTLQPTATGQLLPQATPDRLRTQVAQAVFQLTQPADGESLQKAQLTLQAATQSAVDAQALKDVVRLNCDETVRIALESGDLRAIEEKAGLAGCDLSGFDLSGVDLSRTVLQDVILSGTLLDDANLSAADLRGAQIENAQTRNTDLSYALLENATIWMTEDTEYLLEGVDLRRANIVLPQELDWVQQPNAAWSPDGNQLAMPVRMGVFLFNLQTGAGRRAELPYSAVDLAWSPDGKLLALAEQERVHLLDAATLQEVQLAVFSPVQVLGAGWNPTGNLLGVATAEGVVIYDPVLQGIVARLPEACRADVQTVHDAWSVDGSRLFCAGETITLWDVRSAQPVQQLKADSRGVLGVAWNGDGAFLALQRQGTVEVWDVALDQSKGVFAAQSMAWSPTRRFLMLAAPDGFQRWDVFLMSWQPGLGFLNGRRVLGISPDGASFLYVGAQWVTISPTRRAISYP